MNNISTLVENVKDIGVDNWNALKTIGSFLNYIIHPSLAIHALWGFTQVYSFWICLFVAMGSMLMYGFGFKKFAKYVPFSMVIYGFIKFIGSAFNA